jgi:tetratricopeptide (TPR) repeat protein
VPGLEKLLADGRRSYGATGSKGDDLARADRLYGEGKYAESVPAYRAALAGIPETDPRWARAAESLLFALSATRQGEECVALALRAYPKLRGTLNGADFAGAGLECAMHMPPDAKDRAETVARFEAAVKESLADPKLPLAADDRSALYQALYNAREDAKDEAGMAAVAREWVGDLDARAARAQTDEQRTAMDPNRLGAYQAAGEIEKAIPMLERSEREFPKDYNPPARLAFVYQRLGRWDEALAASDRALALVYGPRRIRVLLVRADIYKGKGDSARERKTLEDAVAFAKSLPEGQRSEETIADLEKRLGELGKS